jgi:CheY-like chemotaxis protein
MKLIEKSLQAQGGDATVHYGVNGVTCEIRLPLKTATWSKDPRNAHRSALRLQAQASICDTSVLVVEDEPMTSMDLVTSLTEAGCKVVGPAGNVNRAMQLIDDESFDVALLDANLAGQPVDELAAALTRHNVSFAFVTGYGRDDLPHAFREAPILCKPFVRQELFETIGRLVQQTSCAIPLRLVLKAGNNWHSSRGGGLFRIPS